MLLSCGTASPDFILHRGLCRRKSGRPSGRLPAPALPPTQNAGRTGKKRPHQPHPSLSSSQREMSPDLSKTL